MAYALVALGFVLALNAAGAVNFAHGDLVVLGGAVAVVAGSWTGLPGPLLLPLVALALGLAGVIAARVAILPLVRRPPEATFVATIALGRHHRTGTDRHDGRGAAHRAGLGRQRRRRDRGLRAWPPAARHRRGWCRAGGRGVVPARAHADRPAHARRRGRSIHGAGRRHSGRPLRHPVAGAGRRPGRHRGLPARPPVPGLADAGRRVTC